MQTLSLILSKLQKTEERDVDVTREDQAMINSFGRLNARMHELEAEKRLKEVLYFIFLVLFYFFPFLLNYNLFQEDINNLQDASNELILAEDGDDPIL